MLKRRLPPAQVQIGTAKITLSRKIASQLAQAAIERCISLDKEIAQADDPCEVVEYAHKDWSTNLDLVGQLDTQIDQFKSAAAILAGKDVVANPSPLIDLAATVRASFDTLESIDPEYDLSRVDDTVKALLETAEALEADRKTLKTRRIKHDDLCKRLTLRALTLDHVDVEDLQMSYELPDDFDLPPMRDAHERDVNGRIARDANGHYRTKAMLWREDVRKAARAYFAEEREYADRQKRARKAEARKAARQQVRGLWR